MGTTLEYLQSEKRDDILALAEKHGVKDVRIFGSVVRGDDRPDSDIDFLISLGEGGGISEWFNFKFGLEDLLHRQIDVVPEKNLHWFVRPQILAEAKPL